MFDWAASNTSFSERGIGDEPKIKHRIRLSSKECEGGTLGVKSSESTIDGISLSTLLRGFKLEGALKS